jgi:hypothetical protein
VNGEKDGLIVAMLLQVALYRYRMVNPNPHCFIAITKATACG